MREDCRWTSVKMNFFNIVLVILSTIILIRAQNVKLTDSLFRTSTPKPTDMQVTTPRPTKAMVINVPPQETDDEMKQMEPLEVSGFITRNGTIYEVDDQAGIGQIANDNKANKGGEFVCKFGAIVVYSDHPCDQVKDTHQNMKKKTEMQDTSDVSEDILADDVDEESETAVNQANRAQGNMQKRQNQKKRQKNRRNNKKRVQMPDKRKIKIRTRKYRNGAINRNAALIQQLQQQLQTQIQQQPANAQQTAQNIVFQNVRPQNLLSILQQAQGSNRRPQRGQQQQNQQAPRRPRPQRNNRTNNRRRNQQSKSQLLEAGSSRNDFPIYEIISA